MTDKELLELAAKAIGIEIPSDNDFDEIGRQYCESLGLWVKFPWGWDWFNPLGNDKHALLTSVHLGFLVNIDTKHGWTEAGVEFTRYERELHSNSDPYEATRRAIVRAAAEIGRFK